jgi:hypothetical protein
MFGNSKNVLIPNSKNNQNREIHCHVNPIYSNNQNSLYYDSFNQNAPLLSTNSEIIEWFRAHQKYIENLRLHSYIQSQMYSQNMYLFSHLNTLINPYALSFRQWYQIFWINNVNFHRMITLYQNIQYVNFINLTRAARENYDKKKLVVNNICKNLNPNPMLSKRNYSKFQSSYTLIVNVFFR